MLGIPVGTVKSRLHAARLALQAAIDAETGDATDDDVRCAARTVGRPATRGGIPSAGIVDPTPTGLAQVTVDRVRTVERPQPAWRRWLPAAAVVVLAVGVAAGGIALSDQVIGRDLFRPGPDGGPQDARHGRIRLRVPGVMALL